MSQDNLGQLLLGEDKSDELLEVDGKLDKILQGLLCVDLLAVRGIFLKLLDFFDNLVDVFITAGHLSSELVLEHLKFLLVNLSVRLRCLTNRGFDLLFSSAFCSLFLTLRSRYDSRLIRRLWHHLNSLSS